MIGRASFSHPSGGGGAEKKPKQIDLDAGGTTGP